MQFLFCHQSYLWRSGTNSRVKNWRISAIFHTIPILIIESVRCVFLHYKAFGQNAQEHLKKILKKGTEIVF